MESVDEASLDASRVASSPEPAQAISEEAVNSAHAIVQTLTLRARGLRADGCAASSGCVLVLHWVDGEFIFSGSDQAAQKRIAHLNGSMRPCLS